MTNTNSIVAINNLINEVLRKYFIAYPEKQEGYTPALVTVDCPITVEDFSKLSNCVRNYDIFTQYIENYKQEEEAEKRNKELNAKFNSILTGYGIKDVWDVSILKTNCGTVSSRLLVAEEAVAEYINKLFKKDDSMKKQNNNLETNNSTNNNKEVITMTNEMIKKLDTLNRIEQLVQVLEWCDNITNKHDVYYVKKDVLAKFLFDKDIIARDLSKNELKRTGRDKLIDTLRDTVNNLNKESTFVPVEFNDGFATKILEKVIYQANTNKAHNFISDWMLTSIISELIIGLPLKDKGVEHYKTFTDKQKKNLAEIRKAFIKRAKLVAKYNNSKITGYYIPAKILVWGRHKYLGVACVYRFMSGNKVAAEYHVSLNGIKNIATDTITALDDNAYAILDSKCVFVM